jgi:hypothetical protein
MSESSLGTWWFRVLRLNERWVLGSGRVLPLLVAAVIGVLFLSSSNQVFAQRPGVLFDEPDDYELAPPPPPPPPYEVDDSVPPPPKPATGVGYQPFNPYAPFFINLSVMVSYWDDVMIYGQIGDLDGPIDDLLVDFGGELEGSFTFTTEGGFFAIWFPQPGPGMHVYTVRVQDVDGNWSDQQTVTHIQ